MTRAGKKKSDTPESQRLHKEITHLETKIECAYLANHDEYAARLESKVAMLEERVAEIKTLEAEKARKEKAHKYFSQPAPNQGDRPGKKPMLCSICEKTTTPEDSEVVDKARVCLGCLSWMVKPSLRH